MAVDGEAIVEWRNGRLRCGLRGHLLVVEFGVEAGEDGREDRGEDRASDGRDDGPDDEGVPLPCP